MPDAITGKLTEAEKEAVVGFLARFKNADGEYPPCPLCASREWLLGDHIVQPVVVARSQLLFNSASYPHVVVISAECGYTVFFNTIVAGINPPPNEAQQPGS